jgi:hypothetical protein
MAPLSTLLHLYLSTLLRYVGLLSVQSTGWGTRQSVEVGFTIASGSAKA